MTSPTTLDSEHAIVAEGLRKRYGADQWALDGVDLTVRTGTVLGLLGPNGAGKTTTVRILTTLLQADAGRALVAGFDTATHPQQVRARIGLTGQYAAVDEVLTGRANLEMVGRLYHLNGRAARQRADELLERFSLTDVATRKAGTYSGGMRRRLDLAASLVATPSILFLDEPTTGLDPQNRNEMWKVVHELVHDGTTVLLTTQYLEEADQLADRIAVIDAGRVIAEGTAAELKRGAGEDQVHVLVHDPQLLPAVDTVLRKVTGDATVRLQPATRTAVVDVPRGIDVLTEAVHVLRSEGIPVEDIAVRRPTLDDVFLRLTGHIASGSSSGPPAPDNDPATAHQKEEV